MSTSLVNLASLVSAFNPVTPQLRVAAIIVRGTQILLVEHRKRGQHYWVLPGGRLEGLETLDTALKAADTGHLVFSTLHTTDATQTINRVLSFYPPHQQAEVRFSLATALQAVVSLRLVPRADKPGRIPACEILINTAAVRDNIRDMNATLNIPDLIKEGTVQYGMQSFDQSLMGWYTKGIISYESAVFFATSPGEFALRVQGVAGTSDNTWAGFESDSSS